MNLIVFLFHYLIALSYIWMPEKLMVYYVIALTVYLYVYYIKIKKTNIYTDVHPFLLGYLSVWLIEILPIGNQENLSYTLILLGYVYALYQEKLNEDIKVKNEKEIIKSVIYVVVIPFTAFLATMYILQDKSLAFLIYYASLFFGLYQSRIWLKYIAFDTCLVINVSLLMFYSFEYLNLNAIEKGCYLFVFFLSVVYSKSNHQKLVSRGS